MNKTHPYRVSTWIPGNANPRSIFERGVWSEMARCTDKRRADEVALCLSIRHPDGVQIAELSSDGQRWHPYKYLPETARDLE